MAGTYGIFHRAERIERAAAEVYRAAAEAFPDAPEAALLRRLADEEEQHASRVRLLASRYRHDPSLFKKAELEADALDGLLLETQGLKSEIAAGRWKGNLPGLLERLARMESDGEHSHADLLARGSDPRVSGFFRQMAAQDRAHLELLRRATSR